MSAPSAGRIASITVHRVNISLEAPYCWAVGWYHGATKGIVEVETDEGLTGLGEAPSLDLADYVEERTAPALIGLDPLDLDACMAAAVPAHRALRNTHEETALRAF